MGVRGRWFNAEYADRYFAELETCREQYGDRLIIRSGVELGQSHLDREEACKLLARPYDYVIGSVHKLGNVDLTLIRLKESNYDLVGDTYYASMYELAKNGDYDCIGHLDYFKKQCARCGVEDRFEQHEKQIREILHVVVERGKGLEVNTACLNNVPGPVSWETMPDLPVLRLYREMGGQIVTLGSDAHVTNRVGFGFDLAARRLRLTGFEKISRFEGRRLLQDDDPAKEQVG